MISHNIVYSLLILLQKMTSPAASAAVSAVAAAPYSTFDSLRLGRSAQTVVGRLIRFWDAKNINKNGELLGITILLLDEKVSYYQLPCVNFIHPIY